MPPVASGYFRWRPDVDTSWIFGRKASAALDAVGSRLAQEIGAVSSGIAFISRSAQSLDQVGTVWPISDRRCGLATVRITSRRGDGKPDSTSFRDMFAPTSKHANLACFLKKKKNAGSFMSAASDRRLTIFRRNFVGILNRCSVEDRR